MLGLRNGLDIGWIGTIGNTLKEIIQSATQWID